MTALFFALDGEGVDNEKIVLELIKHTDTNIKSKHYKLYDYKNNKFHSETPPFTAVYFALTQNRSQKIIDALIEAGASFGDTVKEKLRFVTAINNRSSALIKSGETDLALKNYDMMIDIFGDQKIEEIKYVEAWGLSGKYELYLTMNKQFPFAQKERLSEIAEKEERIMKPYSMLHILETSLTKNNDQAVKSWKEKYGVGALKTWDFVPLQQWASNIQNKEVKERITRYLTVFSAK